MTQRAPFRPPQIFDLTIVGGGIVGLATAYTLLRKQPDLRLCLVEKEGRIAGHQTGHNSGVLHTGIYYRPGSQKARLCRTGHAQMVEFCRQEDLPHELCGKVIVATEEDELPRLEALARRALTNDVRVQRLDSHQLSEIEPHAAGISALHVPDAGITNYPAVAQRLLERVEGYSADLRLQTEVLELQQIDGHLRIVTNQGAIESRFLITCGGLHSDRLARLSGARLDMQIVPFRGEYYRLNEEASAWVRHLIYPVPNPEFPFLGVHLTREVDGEVECGPNAVLNLGRECYQKGSINPSDLSETLSFPGFWRLAHRHRKMGLSEVKRSLSRKRFAQSVARLVPAISEQHLIPHQAGIRAQAVDAAGRLIDDFLFVDAPGSLHVVNAPSPAATSSLAIAEHIANRYQAIVGS